MLDIKREAEERRAALTPDAEDAAQRREFWEAIAICCQAVVDLSTRYAEAAARMAGATADGARRAELERVAAVCRRVPGLPARTFHEALQSVWFLDFVLHAVCGARDYSVGRLDQYLLPFYRRDIGGGVLTREEALELLQCLFVKMNSFIGIHDHYTTPVKRSLCKDSVQYVVVGGQTADGRDATERAIAPLPGGHRRLTDQGAEPDRPLPPRHRPRILAERLRRRAPGGQHRDL